VHSFTSPLGVLLPALASLLTANTSDAAALWIFRVMSITAFAGAGVFLWRLATALFSQRLSAGLLVALFATDAKIVDFSTNGMETGFLLLFLSWTLFALWTNPSRQWLHLGCAWAGLMWTRPDSFIYIGALAAGSILVPPRPARTKSRFTLLKLFLCAGILTTALYLPWLIWAWVYYGTPVPHTVIAKGLFNERTTLAALWNALVQFPAAIFRDRTLLTATFMPPYSSNTGWPATALHSSFWIALAAVITWLLPRVRPEARIASFAFFVGHFYLSTFVGFPVPWYLPTVTLFSLFVISSGIDQMLKASHPALRSVVLGCAGLLFTAGLTMCGLTAFQMRWQQRLIEEGQRTQIGRWLRANATTPRDTVFLEPLGYVGFYSNLKMLDYPGLSSPEVIAARRRIESHAYPFNWAALVLGLTPDWLVLRESEKAAMRAQAPMLFDRFYSLARIFDAREKVRALPFMPGRGYLTNDAYFEVYHRIATWPDEGGVPVTFQQVTAAVLTVNEVNGNSARDSGAYLPAHAPSRFAFRKPLGARWLTGTFLIVEGAYTNSNPADATDGAVFGITWTPTGGQRQEVFSRFLNPHANAADRGHQSFDVELPADAEGSIELTVSPGPQGKNTYDWTQWSSLTLVSPVK
jgi:hypothetical protein